jgi:hypothetical protein
MARSANTRSAQRRTPVVPVTLDLFRAVVADAVRDARPFHEGVAPQPATLRVPALPSNDGPEEDATPSAAVLHDRQEEAPQEFTNRNVDLADPAQRFFSDVARKPKPKVVVERSEKPVERVTPPTAPVVALTEDRRVEAAVEALEKARQVLAFVNPDLKGRTRKWNVNSNARKRANEASLELVHRALKSLTS